MTANIYAVLVASIDSGREREILETDDGRAYTRADLACESARLAHLMLDAGAVRGDRIAVQVEKSPASLFLYLGCLRPIVVYMPVNTSYQR
jgi:malonyl-CoA/methylmalonyl-CoA synthetase